MYSYGGIFHDSGNKSDISNWIDTPKLVTDYDNTHKSVDPRRVAHRMFSHVSSRGSCVMPPVSPGPPVLFATYDATLKVPKCTAVAKMCSSGNLLEGRGNIGPAEGGTSPNSLDTCVDGTNGSYLSDESLEAIKVSSVDGDFLTAGLPAEIEAAAYVWSSIQSEHLRLHCKHHARMLIHNHFDDFFQILSISTTLPNLTAQVGI
jgi:hypothetical protein